MIKNAQFSTCCYQVYSYGASLSIETHGHFIYKCGGTVITTTICVHSLL